MRRLRFALLLTIVVLFCLAAASFAQTNLNVDNTIKEYGSFDGSSVDMVNLQNGNGSILLAVNAGSGTVASLAVAANGITLVSVVSSGGTFPNSIALLGNLAYVLNAEGTPNISGFRLSATGALQPIAGSTRMLPGGTAAGAHDIRFSPDGARLLVTEGGTNQIDVFAVGSDGTTTGVTTQTSAGSGPFGMRFGRGDVLTVVEANSPSVSTYELTNQNTLQVITPALANGQAPSCWISLTSNGHAFVSDTGSGTLSSYQVAADGTLNLASAVAANAAGGAPIDSALSNEGRFLYADDSALGRVLIYRVNGNSLSLISTVNGLPTSVQGIVVQ